MRGATKIFPTMQRRSPISIHAPHAGRDGVLGPCSYQNTYFNPRAPCGARRFFRDKFRIGSGFQSTRPMRGATQRLAPAASGIIFQSTRPMRGATQDIAIGQAFSLISIHAPHAGRDADREASKKWNEISIHAPHAGRDPEPVAAVNTICNFNPRAPCGARLGASLEDRDAGKFQSTRPMRGATQRIKVAQNGEADFNPRAPCGARRFFRDKFRIGSGFQSTRPMRGAT